MVKQQRGEATVEHVLTTALRLYGESDGQGFTVNAVTTASGVSLRVRPLLRATPAGRALARTDEDRARQLEQRALRNERG